MVELLSSPEAWLSLATLTALEIVLGVDNIIFIAILAGRLPAAQRERARKLGLAGAFVSRLGLLATISWIVRLDQPLFEVAGQGFSGKALILLGGGLFLLYKATKEIHHKLEAAEGDGAAPKTWRRMQFATQPTNLRVSIGDLEVGRSTHRISMLNRAPERGTTTA